MLTTLLHQTLDHYLLNTGISKWINNLINEKVFFFLRSLGLWINKSNVCNVRHRNTARKLLSLIFMIVSWHDCSHSTFKEPWLFLCSRDLWNQLCIWLTPKRRLPLHVLSLEQPCRVFTCNVKAWFPPESSHICLQVKEPTAQERKVLHCLRAAACR